MLHDSCVLQGLGPRSSTANQARWVSAVAGMLKMLRLPRWLSAATGIDTECQLLRLREVLIFTVLRHIELLDGGLDLVDVSRRGFEIQSNAEIHHCPVHLIEFLVYLAHLKVHGSLPGRLILQRLQFLNGLVIELHTHQDTSLLKLHNRSSQP
eukprot:scaffold2377_cov376-Prasinococcus_capsulatus_cf.AAC.11